MKQTISGTYVLQDRHADYQWLRDLWYAGWSKPIAVGIDCETKTLRNNAKQPDPQRDDLVGVGLAITDYILGHGDLMLPIYGLATDGYLEVLREILPKASWYAANAMFDATVLRRYGVRLGEHAGDPRIVAYMLGEIEAGLKPLLQKWLDFDTLEYHEILEQWNAQDISEVPIEAQADYCALQDATQCVILEQTMRASLTERVLAVYTKVELPMVNILVGMTHRGIRFDREAAIPILEVEARGRDVMDELIGREVEATGFKQWEMKSSVDVSDDRANVGIYHDARSLQGALSRPFLLDALQICTPHAQSVARLLLVAALQQDMEEALEAWELSVSPEDPTYTVVDVLPSLASLCGVPSHPNVSDIGITGVGQLAIQTFVIGKHHVELGIALRTLLHQRTQLSTPAQNHQSCIYCSLNSRRLQDGDFYLRRCEQCKGGKKAKLTCERCWGCGKEFPRPVAFNPASTDQVREWLYVYMAAPVKRRSKDSGEASTDSLALLQLKGFHPAIPLILSRKKFAKRAQFLTKWLEFSAPDGRLHPMFNNTRVATGRLSSSNPNCQQITLDLRSLFIAD